MTAELRNLPQTSVRSEGQRHDSIHEGDRGSWQCDGGSTEQKYGGIRGNARRDSGKTGRGYCIRRGA